ncbi:type VI secretion system tube protein Hcp [Methylosinus sporium]|uniref:type VI secretion system tube protein Hcp n=1 Tax=Methylosinus sporium TaxID=428 RepID=UPI00383A8C0A
MSSTNYTLQIDSVRGEARRGGKDDLIEVLGFEYATTANHFQGEPGHKRRSYSNVRFRKVVDRSSVTIQQMLAQNTKVRKATLSLTKGGGEPLVYYTLILKDAYFVSYKICGEDAADEFAALPKEEFEISYRRLEVEYEAQDDRGLKDGAVSFADDIASND